MPDETNYAWRITKDQLHEEFPDSTDETNTTGPSDAPESLIAALSDNPLETIGYLPTAYKFRMFDDDGILYYSGRMVTSLEIPTKRELAGPLYDFGGPGAGCTLIKYQGHPEWTIEY